MVCVLADALDLWGGFGVTRDAVGVVVGWDVMCVSGASGSGGVLVGCGGPNRVARLAVGAAAWPAIVAAASIGDGGMGNFSCAFPDGAKSARCGVVGLSGRLVACVVGVVGSLRLLGLVWRSA